MISTGGARYRYPGVPVSKAPSFVSPLGLLHSGAGVLGRLGRRAAQLAQATRLLRECLAPPLAEHASVATIRGTTLVVVVDSPVWAARLRYRSAEILDYFASALESPRLTRLETLVRPPLAETGRASRTAPRRMPRPSPRLVRNLSGSLPSGPLRERVERLASPEPPPREDPERISAETDRGSEGAD